MNGYLYKVYCFRDGDKQIWFEIEDVESGKGVAWSPSRATLLKKVKRMGYRILNDDPVIKFYVSKATA